MILLKKISWISLFLVLTSSCAHANHSTDSNFSSAQQNSSYPDVWWQAVPLDQVAGWEIPPQAADRNKNEVVLSKRNELGQFSNLGPAGFTLDGLTYGSVEGLWQAMKYPESPMDERLKNTSVVWPYTREQVMAMKGFEAKKAGDLANANMKKLGIKWVTYLGKKLDSNGKDSDQHYQIILSACRAKLAQNPQLTQLLLSTGDLKFLADHIQKPDSLPAYKYHEIYMRLRNELIK